MTGLSDWDTQPTNDKIDTVPTHGMTVLSEHRCDRASSGGADKHQGRHEQVAADRNINSQTRRGLLGTISSVGVVGLAGCLGGGEDSDEEPTPTETIHPKLRVGDKALTDVFPIQLVDAEIDDVVGEVHWHGDDFSHWHFQPLEVPLDGFRNVRANFRDRSREPIPLGEDETYHLEVVPSDGTDGEFVDVEVTGNLINFEGVATGTGTFVFHLVDGGERVFTSPLLEVEVVEE